MIYRLGNFIKISPWVAIAGYAVLIAVTPNSLWLDVAKVQVYDAQEGEPPRMAVVRTIGAPFHARWTVAVKDSSGAGVCVASGEADYLPGTPLPAKLDLNWWTFPAKCDLPAGAYLVRTAWIFRAWGIERNVHINSNVFIVHERSPPHQDAGASIAP